MPRSSRWHGATGPCGVTAPPARSPTRARRPSAPPTSPELKLRWFFKADDVVTATPAVVGDSVYVGDWQGRFYALRRADGTVRWKYATKVHPTTYSGQIVSSAAVADVAGEQTVYFGGGKTLYALRARDGKLRWKHELGRPGDGDDPTEIESSPVVVDGMVIFGWDVHNSDGRRARGRGRARRGHRGAALGVRPRGGPADRMRRRVVVADGRRRSRPGVRRRRGTARRHRRAGVATPRRSSPSTSKTGKPKWVYQPHEPNNDDFDFAGAPNLFTGAGGDPLVGLGNKDGVYYAVDREHRRRSCGSARSPSPGSRARAATSRPAASSARPRTPTA